MAASRCATTTPPFASRQRGSEDSTPYGSPRLDRPGNDSKCSVRERTPVLSAEPPNTISRSLAPGLVKGTRSAAARRATSGGGARWQRSRRPGAAPVCGCRSVHHSYRPVLARRARRILVKQLTELGYEVLQAADASDALEVLGTERKIDLLPTDIVTARGCERL